MGRKLLYIWSFRPINLEASWKTHVCGGRVTEGARSDASVPFRSLDPGEFALIVAIRRLLRPHRGGGARNPHEAHEPSRASSRDSRLRPETHALVTNLHAPRPNPHALRPETHASK